MEKLFTYFFEQHFTYDTVQYCYIIMDLEKKEFVVGSFLLSLLFTSFVGIMAMEAIFIKVSLNYNVFM